MFLRPLFWIAGRRSSSPRICASSSIEMSTSRTMPHGAPAALLVARPHDGPDVALALAHAAALARIVDEVGQVDLGEGDADEVAAFAADQLAAGDVLAEVALDPAADNLLEAIVILIDAA